jgi:hypothetical protein
VDVHVGTFGVAQQEASGEFSGLHPDVASLSGFSDVKYLTRCFLDWFKQTRAEYRAANRPATLRDNEIEPVAAEATAALIRARRTRRTRKRPPAERAFLVRRQCRDAVSGSGVLRTGCHQRTDQLARAPTPKRRCR